MPKELICPECGLSTSSREHLEGLGVHGNEASRAANEAYLEERRRRPVAQAEARLAAAAVEGLEPRSPEETPDPEVEAPAAWTSTRNMAKADLLIIATREGVAVDKGDPPLEERTVSALQAMIRTNRTRIDGEREKAAIDAEAEARKDL